MEKVFVVGISAFLGHHCVLELLKNGCQVRGLIRDLKKKSEVLNGLKKEVDLIEKLEFVKKEIFNCEPISFEKTIKDYTKSIQHLI